MIEVRLDENVEKVSVYFRFLKERAVPTGIRRILRETDSERRTRIENNSTGRGVEIVEEVKNCSMKLLSVNLEAAGYHLVNGFCQQQVDGTGYHIQRLRFDFARNATDGAELKKNQPMLATALQQICDESAWSVRVFDNPFHRDGEEITGKRAFSVNANARVPLFENGKPKMVWSKDGVGESKIKIPLKASEVLILEGPGAKIDKQQLVESLV